MVCSVSESFKSKWFARPYLEMDDNGCRPIPIKEIPDYLPSFTHGTCTASASAPVLWQKDDALFIFKKDPADCSHLFIERLAARVGYGIGAPIAPARIARHKAYGVGCASLVLDPQARAMAKPAHDFSTSTVTGVWREQVKTLVLFNLLIGNSDNAAHKHVLCSETMGLYAFDFGNGSAHKPETRYGLSLLGDLGDGARNNARIAEDLVAQARAVRLDGLREEAALFERDYPKKSLCAAISAFVSGTAARLKALQNGEIHVGEGAQRSLYVRLGNSTGSPSMSLT